MREKKRKKSGKEERAGAPKKEPNVKKAERKVLGEVVDPSKPVSLAMSLLS